MKITLEKGMDIQYAIDELKKFINENFEDYPKLKSDMNLYLSLKNNNGDICPQNEKEYKIASNSYVDVLEDEKEKAYSAIRKLLYSYYDWELRKREAFLHDISVAENYISTANEKGRKPENIEKRKKALLKYQEKLKIVDESVSFYGLLIDFLVNHKVKVLFIQHNNKSRYYSGVRFECILLFYEKEKIDGYFGSNGFTHKIPEKYRNYLD